MKKIFFLFLINLFIFAPQINAQENNMKNVLLIYNAPNVLNSNNFAKYNDFSLLIAEQLGHFSAKVKRIKEIDYKKGMLNDYDIIFYLQLKDSNYIPKCLLADLLSTEKEVVWYGQGIRTLLANKSNIPMKYIGDSKIFNLIKYKNHQYKVEQKIYSNMLIEPFSSEVKIFGQISNGFNEYPLILNWENYWILTGGVYSMTVEYLIFSDVLHEIFKEEHKTKRTIYLRIEDVHTYRDTEKLKKIANYLYSEKVPFIIALIPIFVDKDTGKEIPITENPELIETLHYMIERNGTVVLHGCTHQYYRDETGEGFEFWDAHLNKPLEIDYEDFVYQRVSKGINVLIENNLYPLAFEAPHYGMALQGNQEIKKYFSTVIGQIQTTNTTYVTDVTPYELINTDLYNIFLPESLGYIEENSNRSVEKILQNAEKLLIVRDSVTGMFFHSFMDIEYLKQSIEELKKLGYIFGDLRQLENWVSIDNHNICLEQGKIIYNNAIVKPEITLSEQKKPFFAIVKTLAKIILFIIIISLIYFFIKFLKVRKQQRKKLFKE